MPTQYEKGGRAILWTTLLLTALVLGFALGGGGVYYYLHENETATPSATEPEPAAELDKVVALGRIEPKGGTLSLGVPTPDRIRRILVKEGQDVKKDQPLAVLDSEVMRKLEKHQAEIQLHVAKKRRQAVEANGKAKIHVEEVRRDQIKQLEPIELRTLRSKIALLKAQQANAEVNYKRYLAAGDTVADQDKEKQELVLRQVQAELTAEENHKEKLHESTALDLKVADAQLDAARAELEHSLSTISLNLLETQVDQADERLKETQIHAPSKGKVLRILVHEGELVRAQPIIQMANVDKMIVLVEVYETDIERVRVGQSATITSHIFEESKKKPLTGKVVWIASSVGKAEVVPLDPRAAVDNRVVDVKVELDQPARVAKLIGHQVRVTIHTGSNAGPR
ncbi:MAG TPA: efflux RND transporter periplasmic adaptor subunit [Gemmataceae bacterium]|nr:efflux RND transporter periplasmic adaptor subunit [Gemmataceae bacterium]